MSIWTDISDFEKYFISLLSKQTDVSAECEDSIKFDKYGNLIINGSTIYIYQ